MKRIIFRGTLIYMLVCILILSPSITHAHTEVKERGFFASIYCKVISVVGMECDELEEDTHDDHADETPAPSNPQTNSVVPNRNENRITATSTQTTQSQTPTQTPPTSTAQPTIIERITTPVTTIVQGITLDFFNTRIQELKEELALSSSNRSVSRNTFSKQTDNIHEDFTEADTTLETSLLEVISTATTTLSSNSFNQNGNAFGTTATLGTTDNNPLSLITNNTSRLTVTEDGNVGIGTSNPTHKLRVEGNIRFDVSSTDDGIFGYSNSNNQIFSLTRQAGGVNTTTALNSYYGFGIQTGNTTNDPGSDYDFYINSGGDVGIGTTTPTSKLTIDGLPDTNNYNSLQIMGNAGNGHYVSLIREDKPTQGFLLSRGNIEGDTPYTGAAFITTVGGDDQNLQIQAGKDLSGVSGNIRLNYYGGLTGIGPSAWTPTALLHVGSSTPSVDLFRVDGSAGNTFIYTQGGNVGIGTTTPSSKLHITSTVAAATLLTIDSNSNSSYDPIFQIKNTGSTGGDSTVIETGKNRSTYFRYGSNSSTEGLFFQRDTGLVGSPVDIMTLTDGGNIGIGTTTPSEKLSISTNGNGLGIRATTNLAATATGLLIDWDGESDDTIFKLRSVANPATTAFTDSDTKFVVTGTGNVGIGTTAPSAKLELQTLNTSDTSLKINRISGQSGNLIQAANFGVTETSPGSTRVGVGIITPLEALHINTTGPAIRFTDTNNSTDWVLDASVSGIGKFRVIDITGGNKIPFTIDQGALTDSLYIASTGNIGIGTTTPTQKLTVSGNAQITSVGSGAYAFDLNLTSDGTLTTSASDRRLKTQEETLDSAETLEKIMQLEPKTFIWKSNGATDIGLIAQEVEEIFPELVFTNQTDGYKGINYSRLPALLVSAIQELTIQLKELVQTVTGFTKFFESEKVQTKELCVDDVCVTRDEFKSVFKNAGSNTNVSESESESESDTEAGEESESEIEIETETGNDSESELGENDDNGDGSGTEDDGDTSGDGSGDTEEDANDIGDDSTSDENEESEDDTNEENTDNETGEGDAGEEGASEDESASDDTDENAETL